MTQAASLSELLRLFETIPDSYLILSPDFTILTASNSYLKATLTERESIQGKSVFDAFPDNPALSYSEATRRLRESLEWVLRHKQTHQLGLIRYDVPQPEPSEGFEEKYWHASHTPVFNSEGDILYIIQKVVDNTELYKSQLRVKDYSQQMDQLSRQQALTRAELVAARNEVDLQQEKLHNIFMKAPALICIFEGPQHVFKLVNPLYQRLVGDRPLLGKPIAEAMPELEGQPVFGLLDRVYQTGVSVHAHEMKVQLDHDNSGELGNNFYNFTYQPIRNLEGKVDSILVFAYEVTDLVESRLKVEQREKALQVLNEQLEAANEEIRAANEELSKTHLALQELNQELEMRVADRTKQLQSSKAETEAQRNLLHNLFMQAPAPIVILDGPDMVFELVNPAYQQIFPGRELLGKTLLQALPEVEATSIPGILKQVYQTGETFVAQELPLMLSRHEGAPPEQMYWTFTYQARLNEKGDVDGVLVFAFEVTGQVKTRQAVEHSAERLQLITDALPVLIGYLDKEERYQFTNYAYQAWFNTDPKNLLGRPVREVIGEKAYQGVKGYIERALAGERLDFESRMPYREDFVKHIRTSYVPDIRQGEVAGFYTLVTDITEQVEVRQQIEEREKEAQALAHELKAANEDLSKSVEAFKKLTHEQQQVVALVENSSDFIGLASPDGNGLYINQAGLDLVGLEKSQVTEVKIVDFFYKEDKSFVSEFVLPILEEKGIWAGELRFCHFQTGESIPVHYNCFSIKDPQTGDLLGLATITIDFSDRKKQEAELQALTTKLARTNEDLRTANKQLTRTNVDLDNFIYAASHDLKAPIFNIEGLLQILIGSLPPQVLDTKGLKGVMGMIEDSIARFKRTIEHLTEVTKLQKENSHATVVVDLAEVIQEVMLDLVPQLDAAAFDMDIDVDDCPHIHFSEKNLRSVVYNLISNAIKYRSPERKLSVQVTCRTEGDYAVLSVRDNGLGMDLKKSNKLFSMFGRLHDHVEGSGVGLYMVKKIVENAEGRIEVDSEIGVGSTFRVYFKT